jgi:WD40 repeat protein
MVAVRPEGAPGPSGDIRSRSIVAVVVLAALVLGYILGASSGLVGDGGELGAGDETTTTEPATTTAAPHPTLEELVPGFDGLLITEGGHPPDLEIAVWHPTTRFPSMSRLPPATSIVPDASGNLLAGLGEMGRGSPYSTLYAGRPGSLWPVAAGVTSFAWHQSEPGRLAWLELESAGGGLHLSHGDMNDVGQFVRGDAVAHLGQLGRAELIGWDHWGFLLQGATDDGPAVFLLDPEGSERWRLQADGASVLAGERIVLRHERWIDSEIDFAFTTPDAAATDPPSTIVRTFQLSWDQFSRAVWAPDGSHLAVMSWESRSAIWRIEVWQHNVVLRETVTFDDRWIWGMSWSPDGRFIVAPAELLDRAGAARYVVMFYDTRLGISFDVPMPHWVQTAFVRQPDGPADEGGLGGSPAPSQ